MAVSGPNSDFVEFTEYISKNLKLYELSNDGTKLSTHAQAHFARNELAQALRRGPYQVNVLLGGYDAPSQGSNDGETKEGGGSLYYMDYLAALQKVSYGAHGYAAYFCLGIMDREYKENLSYDDAMAIIKKCIFELHTRFLISQPNFIVKAIDKDGIRVVEQGADPKDN